MKIIRNLVPALGLLLLGSAHAASVALTGDSTVATYKNQDKQGWGALFGKYLVSGTKLTNFAKGGTSTKTFISEGHWKKAIAGKPNFVFIQFGHNDQSKKHTSASSSFKANLRKMIAEVKKYGGVPVLVSSPRRLRYEGSNRMSDELVPFSNAAREVALEQAVPFVNLNDLSKTAYLKMGEKEALKGFAKGDRTHTNSKGADLLASLVAADAKKNSVLQKLFK
jgi:lysophospholipase L1-like esterase